MHSILIVEDDVDINNLMATILKQSGYGIQQAFSGSEAKLLIENTSFSLMMLDLMLPGLTGEQLLANLRPANKTPVIVLSAKDAELDKVNVLRLGADDYVTKPFHTEELLARVEAVLRRTSNTVTPQSQLLTYKNITLDTQARCVTVNEQPVSLTAREFAILALLMGNPQKVFTKANLYESVWNDEFWGDDNTINVHISNLRTKLGNKDIIQTVWGIGFRLQN